MSDSDSDTTINETGFIGFPVGPVGRRKMSDEERRRRQALAYKKYQAAHKKEIAQQARGRRYAFRDPSLPLDEIEGGGFRCRICNGIIGSHKTFGTHVRSRKHQEAASRSDGSATSAPTDDTGGGNLTQETSSS
jgi:hypothetical protein